ncbi:MAG: MarR family winged helix-turn-helix transcriptional regulator [Acidobacteriota bacterium]
MSIAAEPALVADRLHSAAIHLLRALRKADQAAGLSPARLSALSVLVFRGPASLGELANAEQVQPPTMSRLVAALERDGLVRRAPDPEDRRAVRLEATARGARLLEAGRRRRVARLTRLLDGRSHDERRTLAAAAALIEDLLGE